MHKELLLDHCVVLTTSTKLSDLTLLFCSRSESQPLWHLEILPYSMHLLLLLCFWCGKAHTTAHMWNPEDKSGESDHFHFYVDPEPPWKPVIFWRLIFIFLMHVCIHVRVWGYVCTWVQAPLEARRGHLISWTWSYMQLWAAYCGSKFMFLSTVTSLQSLEIFL